MMASPVQTVLRTIFVHPGFPVAAAQDRPLPTHRLLRDLGHHVRSTQSLDDAFESMEADPIDLLIIDEPLRANSEFERETMSRIQAMPIDQQPRDVAFFSTRSDGISQTKPLVGPRVHVLLKPLHVHGLLQVLRNLE